MKVVAIVALLAALSACRLGPDTSTPEGECAAAADRDPAVQAIQMRMLGNNLAMRELQPDLADARGAAMSRCLRGRGLGPPGGVQRPNRVE